MLTIIFFFLHVLLAAAAARSRLSTEGEEAVEKFIPIQNPLQQNSFFRVASYNARYFDLVNDPLPSLNNLYIDLYQLRVFTLVVQEFPLTFFKSPYYPQVKAIFLEFGMGNICENFIQDGNHTYGTLIVSRTALTDCKVIDLGQGELAGEGKVEYQGRNITLIGAHLERREDANAERINEMNILVKYVLDEGLDKGYTYIAIDTTEQYLSDPIWTLRSGLPIEDSFYMLEWTRPSYSSFQGITRNYIFSLKSMKGMLVGSYVLQAQSDSFAAIIDLWKYPDQLGFTPERKLVPNRLRQF